MNFQELGLTLKREREAQGRTIESVMEATKISRIVLVGLEEGDRSALPHPVYAKGFVKSYARLLGLDAEELAMVVDREYQSEEEEQEEKFYEVSTEASKALQGGEPQKQRKRSVWPSIIVVVVLCFGLIVLALKLNKSDTETVPAQEQTTEEQAPATSQSAPQDEVAQPGSGEDDAAAEASVADEETPAPAPDDQAAEPAAEPTSTPEEPVQQAPAVAEKPEVTTPAAADEEVAEVAEEQEASEEQPKYAHVLVIRATTNKGCWIGLWKGDEARMARDFVLKKGEPLRLMFNSPRRIRIGNAAGVEVTYNGKPYPLTEAKGNIQTLRFGMN